MKVDENMLVKGDFKGVAKAEAEILGCDVPITAQRNAAANLPRQKLSRNGLKTSNSCLILARVD